MTDTDCPALDFPCAGRGCNRRVSRLRERCDLCQKLDYEFAQERARERRERESDEDYNHGSLSDEERNPGLLGR